MNIKNSTEYQPTPEELKAVEEGLTPEQVKDSEIRSKNWEQREKLVGQFSELADYFGCEKRELDLAVQETTEKVIAGAETEEEKQHLLDLIKSAAEYFRVSEKVKDQQYVHGTGTAGLKGIIESGKLTPGGEQISGADQMMAHQTEGSYVSLSENADMGYALSYGYARGFTSPNTSRDQLIDANVINGSNAYVESWDGMSAEEQENMRVEFAKRGVDMNRKFLDQVVERPHYFNKSIAHEQLNLYQLVIDDIQQDRRPEVPDNTPATGEVLDLIGKENINELRNRIWAKIYDELKQYPDTSKERLLGEYQSIFDKIKKRLDRFESLPEERQELESHQYPVVLVIDKEALNASNIKKTTNVNGQEVSIHPSGQEARVYQDIDLTAISEIQTPEVAIPQIREWIQKKIDSTEDAELKSHLENIRLTPLELHDVERVIKKELIRNKEIE